MAGYNIQDNINQNVANIVNTSAEVTKLNKIADTSKKIDESNKELTTKFVNEQRNQRKETNKILKTQGKSISAIDKQLGNMSMLETYLKMHNLGNVATYEPILKDEPIDYSYNFEDLGSSSPTDSIKTNYAQKYMQKQKETNVLLSKQHELAKRKSFRDYVKHIKGGE